MAEQFIERLKRGDIDAMELAFRYSNRKESMADFMGSHEIIKGKGLYLQPINNEYCICNTNQRRYSHLLGFKVAFIVN